MKIALIRREFITHLDGVDRFIANLAEGLKVLGREVFIASWSYRGVRYEELPVWFKDVHGLDYEFEIYTLRGPEEKDKWATMLYEWFVKGSRLLRELDADVALVNGVVPLAFKPKIAVAHGPLIGVTAIQRAVIKALYKTYNHVVCVSKASMREYEGIVKCDAIIPLPLKLSNFKPKPFNKRENIVVHIGTRPVKNPWISIKAVEIPREKGYDIKLVIVGSRSDYIENLCRSKQYVDLLFNVSEKEKNEVICRAKALILPSSNETFSYTSLEAMACGTPPVVSTAVPDDVVIHGHNGLRVGSLDPIEYAIMVERLLVDQDLWLRLSENARIYVTMFDHARVAGKYSQVLADFSHSKI